MPTAMPTTMFIVIIIVLAFALVGAIPAWPHSRNWGSLPATVISIILVVVLILLFSAQTPS